MARHSFGFFLGVSFLAGALTACSSTAPAPKTIRVNEENDQGSVALRIGDTLEVELAGNPTTGYQWEVVAGEGEMLKSMGEAEFIQGTQVVGAGGTFRFQFEAVLAGETNLKLEYKRPFEQDVAPLNTFSIQVKIER
jgi:inhibitor of cysteine peptidase